MNALVRVCACATLLILSFGSALDAQSTEIHGRVVAAASKAPIAIATVDIIDSGATAPIAHTTTADDGGFRVAGLRAGHYRLRIRAIGYVPRVIPAIDLTSASPNADLGTVELTAAPLELQTMVVTGQKQDVQLAPDRNVYVVRDMPTTKGGTALDVLRSVPSVDVDIDNIVSLRGNSGVIVQINGRPSPLKPAQLGNFLAQLSADMVEKVEIIPNPSARDNPEGIAGIINIVLKQNTDAGTSGGVTISGGTTGNAQIGGNAGTQRGPFTVYGSYGFMRDNRPRSDATFRENLFENPVTFLDEAGLRSQIPLVHTVTGSAEYQLGQHDQLSTDLMYSTRIEHEGYDVLYRDLNSSQDLTAMSDRHTKNENHEMHLESSLEYKHSFATEGHELSSELRLDRSREGGPFNTRADSLAADGSPIGVTALEHQVGWEHPGENGVKVDYTRPLNGAVRLETGYSGSQQRFHTTLDTQVFDTTQNAFAPDTSRISNFTYHQLVNAAYGMLDAEHGKFQLQGGLRVEHASTQFHLNTLDSTYDNRYNSLFPSALVAYNIDDAHQVKLSYSTRIRRPDDTDLLDPTPHALDPLNISRGNPKLKPEYIRALELGIQRSADRMTIQVTPFFRHTINAVRTFRTIDSAGVTTRTFANVATNDAYGTDANLALNGGRITGFVGASAFRQVSNAANLGPGLSAKTFGWQARTNATLHITSTLDLQTLLFYQAPMTIEQGHAAARTRFALAARKKLIDDQLSLTLRVIDPFNTSHESTTTIDPSFYQVSTRARVIRGLLLSANWTFGKPPKHGKDSGDQPPDDTPAQ